MKFVLKCKQISVLDLAPAVGSVLNTPQCCIACIDLLCLNWIVFLGSVRLPASQCHQPQSSFNTSRTDGVSYRVLALEHKKGFHDSPLGVASSTVRSHWEGSIDSSCMWDSMLCDIYRCFEYTHQLVSNVVVLMPNELDSWSGMTTLNARWKLKGKCLIHSRISVSFLSGISSPLLWFTSFRISGLKSELLVWMRIAPAEHEQNTITCFCFNYEDWRNYTRHWYPSG